MIDIGRVRVPFRGVVEKTVISILTLKSSRSERSQAKIVVDLLAENDFRWRRSDQSAASVAGGSLIHASISLTSMVRSSLFSEI